MIDTAYRKACRLYHPDSAASTFYTQSKGNESVGRKMSQLAEARKLLVTLSGQDSIDSLWNEEKQEWIQLGSDLLASGCLWDETKEFPIQVVLERVCNSKVLGAFLERMYAKV
jgi:hypothetical protein